LTNPPVLSTTEAPLGFNSSCLCNPDEFRETAPACIDCLFRTDTEDEFRDTLLKGMDGCIKSLNLPACPRKCNGIEQMMAECAEEDAARSAAAAVPTPEIKEDYTQRCICKPMNKEQVELCYKCMLNYDSAAAEKLVLPVRKCDPNYGIQGPLYRPTGPTTDNDDDDENGVGGVSEISSSTFPEISTKTTFTSAGQKKSKLKNIGSNGYSDLMNLVWWIGIQILCVIGAIVYFAI
ncbi:hypothetical protein K440DRAFT_553446, partial [Wilcoxina mikolae CBS 423.85]